MNPKHYAKYIASSDWRKKRRKRLKMDDYKCRLCDEDGSRFPLEVHHRPCSYERIPNESVRDDLITLCRRCHDLITSAIREDRYGKRKYEITIIKPHKQEAKHGLENKNISIDWIDPVADAQWAARSPNKQMGSFDEGDYIEAKQD